MQGRRYSGRIVHLEVGDAVTECESHVGQLGRVVRIRNRYSGRHHVRVANRLHLNQMNSFHFQRSIAGIPRRRHRHPRRHRREDRRENVGVSFNFSLPQE